jgi:hypothetical protein
MRMKSLIATAAALLILGWLISIRSHRAVPTSEPATPVATKHSLFPRRPVSSTRVNLQSAESPAADLSFSNFIALLLKGDAPKLTPDQIESYLSANRRSVESLLAAYRIDGDKQFLKEAEEKFPNDPRVAFAAAFKTDSPEERRHWLDQFKQSAPDNAMPNYLSARDLFKAGQTSQALQEIAAASGKSTFQDYSMDFLQASEEAYRSAGFSDVQAKGIASTQLLLPHLAELKQVGVSLGELAQQYQQAGDDTSAQGTLQMALDLGQHLEQPTGWNTVIEGLVGWAVERIALNAMDPASPYGASAQTVQGRLDEIAQQKASIKSTVQSYEALLGSMSEQDLSAFYDRQKLFGEIEALRWAHGKYDQK